MEASYSKQQPQYGVLCWLLGVPCCRNVAWLAARTRIARFARRVADLLVVDQVDYSSSNCMATARTSYSSYCLLQLAVAGRGQPTEAISRVTKEKARNKSTYTIVYKQWDVDVHHTALHSEHFSVSAKLKNGRLRRKNLFLLPSNCMGSETRVLYRLLFQGEIQSRFTTFWHCAKLRECSVTEIHTLKHHWTNGCQHCVLHTHKEILTLIAETEMHPPPEQCGGVDYRELYRYLADLSAGTHPKQLSPPAARHIMECCMWLSGLSVQPKEPLYRNKEINPLKVAEPMLVLNPADITLWGQPGFCLPKFDQGLPPNPTGDVISQETSPPTTIKLPPS
ncbi:hypothetical protein B566_EDAN002240 [Ephemera danica]|nr:hypothetical protein B566_EDAN002240 [Ephemera danica]